jgi:hypothetical protein
MDTLFVSLLGADSRVKLTCLTLLYTQNIVKNDVSIEKEIDSSHHQIDRADFENQHNFALS